MESDLIDAAVLEEVPVSELRPQQGYQWNRLQEKVWQYLIVDRAGDGQRIQAARALIKRGFFERIEFERCKEILAEYDAWLDENNDSNNGEGESFCLDGMQRFAANMRSRLKQEEELRLRRAAEADRQRAYEQERSNMPAGVCGDWRRCDNAVCVEFRRSNLGQLMAERSVLE